MNPSCKGLRLAMISAPLALCLAAAPASALQMRIYFAPIEQVGTTSSVRLGHAVTATTDYNRLTAGGSFAVSCLDPHTGPITGQNSLSDNGLLGGRQVYVEIPPGVPATRSVPGFESVSFGVTISCLYQWTAFAVDEGYSIGSDGIGIPGGTSETRRADTITFTMLRPDEKRRGCILD